MQNQIDQIDQIDREIFEQLLFLLNDGSLEDADFDRQVRQKEQQLFEGGDYQKLQPLQMAYQLRNFMNEMPGGFFIYHADGNEELIYANVAVLRLFNCDTEGEFRELINNSFRGMVYPDDLEAVERSIAEQIARSKYALDYVEYRIICKDGSIKWVDDYGHFVHSQSAGDIFYVFIGDATEKYKRKMEEKKRLLVERQQKEELQQQIDEYSKELKVVHQEQFRRLEIIEGLSIDYESIFYVDLDKNWMKAYRVSSRFRKKFPEEYQMCAFEGFDSEYIEEWVYPDDRKLLYGVTNIAYIREKLSDDKTFHINYRIYKEEKIEYIQLRIVNVSTENRVSQIVMGYRNMDDEIIQEMKQKQILADALEAANMANNAKNLFLSNMSHDIRTPMNAIVGFTSLIKRHIHDQERVTGYLDMIADSSDQLLQLLNDVLEISRLESGKIRVEEEECSLMDITHQVQLDLLPKAAAKNITLSLDLSNLKHDIVYTDQLKISQTLAYLVDNAIKYTKKGGWVTISVVETEPKEGQSRHTVYRFVVEDNGIGISEDFLQHIFEPFEREKNTTLSGIHGTGLGLTITRKLIEMMGGKIEADSVAGHGSKFTITLPLFMRTDFTHVEETRELPVGVSAPRRILVVDDNEINLEIENEVLKDAGFLVDTAADGSIALEKIKKSKPGDYDLILMDIQMPIMDGYRATKIIREIEDPAIAQIPIIAVSANAFEEDKKKAMESGMNAHLPKPLDTARLYKMIRKFLKDDKRSYPIQDILLRPIIKDEYFLLKDFLYDAIYVPDGKEPPHRTIIEQPELAVYIHDFGRAGDACLVAEMEGKVIGAVWARILSGDVKGYGNIDNNTPELAISVKKNYRRQGVGTRLMDEIISLLKDQGHERVSLSVNKENPAYQMYRKLGFQVVKVREDDYLMVLEL